MGPQTGASRPPALLQRRGRISGTRRIPARRSHSRGRVAVLGPAPTKDNARSGLKNGVPAFPDRLAWGLDTRKSPTAQDRSACLRLFETTSRRPVSPRPAPVHRLHYDRDAHPRVGIKRIHKKIPVIGVDDVDRIAVIPAPRPGLGEPKPEAPVLKAGKSTDQPRLADAKTVLPAKIRFVAVLGNAPAAAHAQPQFRLLPAPRNFFLRAPRRCRFPKVVACGLPASASASRRPGRGSGLGTRPRDRALLPLRPRRLRRPASRRNPLLRR